MMMGRLTCTQSAKFMRTGVCILAGLCLLGLSGCSRGTNKNQLVVYRVKGRVLLNGQPAVGADVVFHPKGGMPIESPPLPEKAAKIMNAGQVKKEPEPLRFPYPTATVDESGYFQVSTYRPQDGCPMGEFVATVSLRKPLNPNVSDPDYGPEEMPKVYTQASSSPLKIDVKGRMTIPPFEITTGTNPGG